LKEKALRESLSLGPPVRGMGVAAEVEDVRVEREGTAATRGRAAVDLRKVRRVSMWGCARS